jgi:thioredoxin-related protein
VNKIVLILVSGFVSLFALEFLSYEEARELQKESGKIIMIDVVRSDCHYCTDMQKNVFENKEMSVWLEKRFIPVKVNLDIDTLPLGLKVSFTPTFFFVDKDEKVVKKIPGAWSIQDFKDLTKNIK